MSNCIGCDVVLTEENWPTYAKDNHVHKCVSCLRKEKSAYAKAWRTSNRATSIERSVKYKKKLALENPVKRRAIDAYSDCRKRAIKTKMQFDLDSAFVQELFASATHCPYFGWELTHDTGRTKTLASIDRIDSSKGYTKDNVQIISYLANVMKSSATDEELTLFAQGILNLKVNK